MRALRLGLLLGSSIALASIAGCRANRVGVVSCEPGNSIFVSCGCQDVGSCEEEPDPVMRICDGATPPEACTWDNQLGENDDGGMTCGRCPGMYVVCPDSGSLLVVPRGLFPDEIVICDWDVRDDGPSI